jgi:glutathione S-transferase
LSDTGGVIVKRVLHGELDTIGMDLQMNEPATREDLQQAADAIRADLRSTTDDIRTELRSTAADIRAEQQRTAENILHLIASLTERMDQRFDAVDKRFDAVDRRFGGMESRFDRLGETVGSLVQQSAGFTRWAEQLDRSNAQILAIQEAQQHYMDKLADRTLKLEQRPPQ